MRDLWSLQAGELVDGIRQRQFSSKAAVESCLARIDQANGRRNALVEVSADEALEAADAADRAVISGDAVPALHGVPAMIKNNSDQAGHVTTDGVAPWRECVAEEDSAPVAKLRSAGAVFVGRSNTPALSYRLCSQTTCTARRSTRGTQE